PQLNNSALTICTASTDKVGRCTFNIPQGDDAKKPWNVLDPTTGLPMPGGIAVAYNPDELWIGNLTPNTILPTKNLRLIYTLNGTGTIWTPDKSTWDIGVWNDRGLQADECIVLYTDASKITPLLPCNPVAKAVLNDQPWKIAFDVMGPREERRAVCGTGQPGP